MNLSILVVSWNTRDLLRECLRSALANLKVVSAEIIVVDNASADGSAEMVRREFAPEPRVRLIANPRNEGFARGNNQAYAAARGEFLAVVNPDVTFTGPVLRGMVEYLHGRPAVGIVSCNLVGTDGSSQSLHRRLPPPRSAPCPRTRRGNRGGHRALAGGGRWRHDLAGIRRGR